MGNALLLLGLPIWILLVPSSHVSFYFIAAQEQIDDHRKLAANTLTFPYTGSVQTWVVPASLATFTIDAYGAQGASYTGGCLGGRGGYISVSNIPTASLPQTLYVYVGGQNGYNGGASSGATKTGGGATDLRTDSSSLASRLVVSGGGGGAGDADNMGGQYTGGAGGGGFGAAGRGYSNGGRGGAGGSQTSGGLGGTFYASCCGTWTSTSGVLGSGGVGADNSGNGGGGYYGGAGGTSHTGGGGGSSFVSSPYNYTVNSQGLRSGDGVLYITYTSFFPCQAGYYLSSTGCLACAAGLYSVANSISCISSCPVNFVSSGAACVCPFLLVGSDTCLLFPTARPTPVPTMPSPQPTPEPSFAPSTSPTPHPKMIEKFTGYLVSSYHTITKDGCRGPIKKMVKLSLEECRHDELNDKYYRYMVKLSARSESAHVIHQFKTTFVDAKCSVFSRVNPPFSHLVRVKIK